MYVGGAHANGADDIGECAASFHCVSALRIPISAEALHGHGLRAGMATSLHLKTEE
jgi:hypothetical protein